MRIFDQDRNKTLKNIILCLTFEEAMELKESLETVMKNKSHTTHEHVNDSEYEHEITVTLYNDENLYGFNSRLLKVIKKDE